MTMRELTPLDKDQIYDLMMRRYIQLSKNPIQARTNENVDEQYNLFLEEHMNFKWVNGLPNEVNKGRAFGYFSNNELMVILTQRFSTSRMPSWYVGNMITCPSLKSYREAAQMTSELLDLVP